MVVHRLRIVVVATWDDVAHIARFHGIVAIFVHQRIGFFKVTLVVLRRTAGFVVHHQFYAFLTGIFVERFQVEIGIRRQEVEHVALPAVCPVFPTDVPTFDKHLVEAVFGSKIDVAAHFFVVRAVATVGRCQLIVDVVELHGRIFVGVVPRRLADDHLPPHAAVFRRVNPTDIVERTRLVEVQNEVRREHIAGVVADDNRAPRRLTRRLHTAFQASCVGCEVTLKEKTLTCSSFLVPRSSFLDQLQVHRRIIHAGRLVDVDVKAVVGAHLQRSLHSILHGCHRRIVPHDRIDLPFVRAVLIKDSALVERLFLTGRNLRQSRRLDGIFLCVVVGRNPPRRMVASERKFRSFLLDNEVVQRVLLWKFIAQSDAVVIDAETNDDVPFFLRLRQRDSVFVVVVSNRFGFAPHGFPRLVER